VVLAALGTILETVNLIMLDTTKMLAAVAAERTENASLRALLVQHVGVETGLSKQLADAIAAAKPVPAPAPGVDAAALQQRIDALTGQLSDLQAAAQSAQNDLDKAASDLSADNEATAAAITANQIPAGEQAAPAPTADQVLANAASAQQIQPAGVAFNVANDANPQKAAPDPAVNQNAGPVPPPANPPQAPINPA
jgi:hypothetical protein